MKKFKFRLERILQYRKIVKDEKTRTLLMKQHKLNQDTEQLRELEAAMLLNRMEENISLSANQVHLMGLYGSRLKERIAEQEIVIEESERHVEEAREDYIEAAKDEESLVILRKKKLAEYKDYVQKEDEKFLDELSVQRAGFKKGK